MNCNPNCNPELWAVSQDARSRQGVGLVFSQAPRSGVAALPGTVGVIGHQAITTLLLASWLFEGLTPGPQRLLCSGGAGSAAAGRSARVASSQAPGLWVGPRNATLIRRRLPVGLCPQPPFRCNEITHDALATAVRAELGVTDNVEKGARSSRPPPPGWEPSAPQPS